MKPEEHAREQRARTAAKAAGLTLTLRSMPVRQSLTMVQRTIDPYGHTFRRRRYWLVTREGVKLGGPDGMSLDDLERALSPASSGGAA